MIISASRRTDIPAYYSNWFFRRLEEGCVLVRNPVSYHQVSHVSLRREDVDCFVFWTKNPLPMMNKLAQLDGWPYLFQFTLTPYGKDIEPGLPEKLLLSDTFRQLAAHAGPERMVWRYDPILLSNKYSLAVHKAQFASISQRLQGSASRCVISFLDCYPAVRKNLAALGARPPAEEERLELAEAFSASARESGMTVASCAETIDLSRFGITHSSCIDPQMIRQVTGCSVKAVKDKNQRPECGCIESVDIGAYSTCPAACQYCYANAGKGRAAIRSNAFSLESPLLCSSLTEEDRVTVKKNQSLLEHQISFL